jgi:type IV pilus assembly protein PilX
MNPNNSNTLFFPDRMARVSSGQQGAALVMALVILLILTILGVTAMSTSSLEQKMAGNIQDLTRAFQAAESGADRVRNSNMQGFDLSTGSTTACDPSSPCQFDNGKSGRASVTPTLVQITQKPQRSSTSSGYGTVGTAHIDIISHGTLGNASNTVHQGVVQPAPPQSQN